MSKRASFLKISFPATAVAVLLLFSGAAFASNMGPAVQVESETVFIGSPTVGKDLFSADPAVGIVVPIRINIFDDGHGNTTVSYVPPSHLLDEVGNPKVSEIAKMLDGKLSNLVGMLGQ